MGKTKLGAASRFGARYGSPLKKIVKKIEEIQRKRQKCPQCGRKALKRVSYAIWECKKCGYKMAGGAYTPTTDVGETVKKITKKQVTEG